MKKCDKYFAGCTFGYPLARTWAVLHKPILQESVTDTCQQLEQVAKVFFFLAHGGNLVFGLITTKCLEVSLGIGCMHLVRCRSQAFVSRAL
jgi:hypothetical protein